MITVTPAAIEQIRKAAEQGNMQGLALRLAATRRDDGSLHYGMGFDQATDDDAELKVQGISVIVGPEHAELLKELTLDYVQLDSGEYNFIFINPADPNYRAPAE